AIRSHKVQTFLFDGYWEDIGTIRSFYEANLSLASAHPPFEIDQAIAPVYTRARFLPPTRCGSASVKHSLIAGGCQIGEGATIENSVIGLRTIIGPGAVIRNSIIMGADYQETIEELEENRQLCRPPIGIGAGALIKGAIIDKNVRVGPQAEIFNQNELENTDPGHPLCVIRDRIPVVVKGSVIPSNWRLAEQLK
ncbi:MAG: glucose-1-phosphate adenylyltransferase, partial [Planctomycetota bacterium]